MSRDPSEQPDSARDVFISSTGTELQRYRHAAIDAVHRAGMIARSIEPGTTVSVGIIRQSLNMVNTAEIFVGIVAENYGAIPYGYDMSIMEMEYRQAAKRGIPILMFLSAGKLPESAGLEPDSIKSEKLAHLKQELTDKYPVQTFSAPRELGDKLYRTLISKDLRDYLDHTETRQG